ncbi:MAG: HAD hydrolase-like protein [Draconibacterium sp.]|nr:HAD hydrolase-like protein [Draconibacterium sp.]
MKTIIWDWNGTLLNDLDFCITTINKLLKIRDLALLDRKSYKAVFSFPVKNYYKNIGFDFEKEDFSIPAKEFIDLYDRGVKNCKLHRSADEVLFHFKELGFRQFVLSAMEQNMLEKTIKHNSVYDFFEGVFGLNDYYAVSKIERGAQLISKFNIEKEKTWMIGDTIHDFEVAKKLGIKCILIGDGHQSDERLKSTGAVVTSELIELKGSGLL